MSVFPLKAVGTNPNKSHTFAIKRRHRRFREYTRVVVGRSRSQLTSEEINTPKNPWARSQ